MYFRYVALIATIVIKVYGVSALSVDKFNQERSPKDVLLPGGSSSGNGGQDLINPVSESSLQFSKSSRLQSNDANDIVDIRDIEEVEEQLDLTPETSMGPDNENQESMVLSSKEEEGDKEVDDLDRRLIRIADHLSKEHLSIGNFKPSVWSLVLIILVPLSDCFSL